MEYSIHGAVHLGLAGDMSTPAASNDFAFFMHHANLDRLWWKWQRTGNRMWVMDGPGPGVSNLTINHQIAYYNEPIRNVMELGFGNMCFTYSDSAPLTGTAPASTMSFATGTSAPSSENTAASNIASSEISPEVREELFPGTNSSTTVSRRGNFRRTKKLIPRPDIMPKSFAQMHNYDYEDVKAHYKEACDFIDTLNNSEYSPVYC
jgi:hypothetical protein